MVSTSLDPRSGAEQCGFCRLSFRASHARGRRFETRRAHFMQAPLRPGFSVSPAAGVDGLWPMLLPDEQTMNPARTLRWHISLDAFRRNGWSPRTCQPTAACHGKQEPDGLRMPPPAAARL